MMLPCVCGHTPNYHRHHLCKGEVLGNYSNRCKCTQYKVARKRNWLLGWRDAKIERRVRDDVYVELLNAFYSITTTSVTNIYGGGLVKCYPVFRVEEALENVLKDKQ